MGLFRNAVLLSAVCGWFAAQIIKIIISLVRYGKFDFSMFVASGGMPSSHSSTVCAMTAAIAVRNGVQSMLFALSAVFSFIVMYDACGVRRAAGEQARILNKIVHDLQSRNTGEFGNDLRELIGHTPLQVFVGAALGVAIGVFLPEVLPV